MADMLADLQKVFDRPPEVKKTLFNMGAGAGGAAAVDGLLEAYYLLSGEARNFPFIELPFVGAYLPPVDDWLVAALPGLEHVLGILLNNKGLEEMGLGGLLYGGGMLAHHTLVRTINQLFTLGIVPVTGKAPTPPVTTPPKSKYMVTG